MGGGLLMEDYFSSLPESSGVRALDDFFLPVYGSDGSLQLPPFVPLATGLANPSKAAPQTSGRRAPSNSTVAGSAATTPANHSARKRERSSNTSPIARPSGSEPSRNTGRVIPVKVQNAMVKDGSSEPRVAAQFGNKTTAAARAPAASPSEAETGSASLPAPGGSATVSSEGGVPVVQEPAPQVVGDGPVTDSTLLESPADASKQLKTSRAGGNSVDGKEATAQHLTGEQSKGHDENDASARIQAAWRGYMVRKERPLEHLRTIAKAKAALRAVEAQCNSAEGWDAICRVSLERLKAGESIMAVLFQLDTVQTSVPFVRQLRKEVVRQATRLQERIDALPPVASFVADQASPAPPQTGGSGSPPTQSDAAPVEEEGRQGQAAAESSGGSDMAVAEEATGGSQEKSKPSVGDEEKGSPSGQPEGAKVEVDSAQRAPLESARLAEQASTGGDESQATAARMVRQVADIPLSGGDGPPLHIPVVTEKHRKAEGRSMEAKGSLREPAGTSSHHKGAPSTRSTTAPNGRSHSNSGFPLEGVIEKPAEVGTSSGQKVQSSGAEPSRDSQARPHPLGSSTALVPHPRGGAGPIALAQSPGPVRAEHPAAWDGSAAEDLRKLRAENEELQAALRQQEALHLRGLLALAARVQQLERAVGSAGAANPFMAPVLDAPQARSAFSEPAPGGDGRQAAFPIWVVPSASPTQQEAHGPDAALHQREHVSAPDTYRLVFPEKARIGAKPVEAKLGPEARRVLEGVPLGRGRYDTSPVNWTLPWAKKALPSELLPHAAQGSVPRGLSEDSMSSLPYVVYG